MYNPVYFRAWYLRNKDKISANGARYRLEHPYKHKTDWKYLKKICRFCDIENVPLIKSSKSKSGRQYYSCRPCNNKRLRKYHTTKSGKKAFHKALNKYYKANPVKVEARREVRYALVSKKLKKPTLCSLCKIKNKKISAHHNDYTKPLEVLWLCPGCHADIHKNNI